MTNKKDDLFLFGEAYRNFLLNRIPRSKNASGRSVVNCRCMECEDSRNLSSMHMYISIPTESEPSFYYCHKCNCSGVVTYKKLIEWGIYDEEISIRLTEHNRKVSNNKKYRKYDSRTIYTVRNDYITTDEMTNRKVVYFNNRLGTNFAFQDFLDLKIVLNLRDLLSRNNIRRYTRAENIVSDLDRAFIGFLSVDNAFVTLRKIGDDKVYQSIDKRYVNYRIFDKEDTSQRFYTVPTKVYTLSTEPLKLHISEGGFDIISIYHNLRNRENGVYTSISGCNYLSVIFHFLLLIKVPNLEIHIYPDNDKYGSNERLRGIVSKILPLGFPTFIHRNNAPNEKDFGVSLDRIQEACYNARDLYLSGTIK